MERLSETSVMGPRRVKMCHSRHAKITMTTAATSAKYNSAFLTGYTKQPLAIDADIGMPPVLANCSRAHPALIHGQAGPLSM